MYKTEYDIVVHPDRMELIDQVNALLAGGWDLLGPPLYQGECWVQAMVILTYDQRELREVKDELREISA